MVLPLNTGSTEAVGFAGERFDGLVADGQHGDRFSVAMQILGWHKAVLV